MKPSRPFAAALLATFAALALPALTHAQAPGIHRTDLQREDLSIPGREVVQVLVAFEPGVVAGSHHHNGEEIVYVTQGALEYRLEGRAPVTLKEGDVLFIPYGVNHEVVNVGAGRSAELATYVVEKGKPLLVPAAAPKAAFAPVEDAPRLDLKFADETPLRPTLFDSATAWEDEP
ncbi:cupin domain-containing protein [Lysobacter arvi]|uniref:Cupin domain-containing protein n=1 Tax=Lysobacter arvi TaxID=3038776 RepID=A0ABU1CGN5_9GAMM|nr:cupin domain-containing protein [Lysobacter arvi]MDR0184092.1 cupin domain-containing protein [Lysobacter arvi]